MHPWCDLIHDQPLRRGEEFDPHNAHILQCVQHSTGQQNRIGPLCVADLCGDGGSVEDAVAVDVLTGIETGDFARRTARGDDGNFGAEVHEPFEHGNGGS